MIFASLMSLFHTRVIFHQLHMEDHCLRDEDMQLNKITQLAEYYLYFAFQDVTKCNMYVYL
jgi:hypothetical protein